MVAQSLGAERVAQTRAIRSGGGCWNVVEEMAIASGVPMPARSTCSTTSIGINAFAAGHHPDAADRRHARGARTR